jgi:hypothetical protein
MAFFSLVQDMAAITSTAVYLSLVQDMAAITLTTHVSTSKAACCEGVGSSWRWRY